MMFTLEGPHKLVTKEGHGWCRGAKKDLWFSLICI